MTIENLMTAAGQYPLELLVVFSALPLCACLIRLMSGPKNGARKPWKYFYSILVYLTCIPGLCAAIVTAYLFLFQRADLTRLNVLVYLLPILSMVLTLIAIRRFVPFDEIPGFDKLSGLMLTIAASFLLALILDRLNVIVIFRGSFWSLVIVAGVIFALFKVGTRLLFKRKSAAG